MMLKGKVALVTGGAGEVDQTDRFQKARRARRRGLCDCLFSLGQSQLHHRHRAQCFRRNRTLHFLTVSPFDPAWAGLRVTGIVLPTLMPEEPF